ncbi:FAD-dependent monooxygenase [Saccharopolyspora sp. HNM0983]|uniref:FAD-dependent monooxygenase n=1 Tax=Saccharopolyspora montiporae TaxID=2781240 RepID=A0A929B8E4_9PSEU|nr:FAD-dependent monooxygenase [Saccharopolyspora sp. HNM0983]MBE9372972.1 FAD-dependent monooxygenase [Saccharopolyspora sp. HNM0983]
MARTAAVVGGGIGGLTTAVGLAARDWQVDVFERAVDLPGTGTALGLWPHALQALDRIGLGEQVRAAGTAQQGGALRRADGRRIAAIDTEQLQRRTGDAVHLLTRPRLLRLLASAAPAVTFGTAVRSTRELSGYDVVVAADGVGSALRAERFGPRYGPRYTGCTAWRGTVDGPCAELTETWGRGALFGMTPQEDRRTNWFASARAPEGERAAAGEVIELRERFAGFPERVREVLARLTEDAVLRHDLYALAPAPPSYVRGEVALIGDAAHAMTPNAGRGACEAIVDGVVLAECLQDRRVADGLARYDALRRGPAARVARMSRGMAALAMSRRLPGLRDAAVRTALRVAGPR